MTYTQHFRMMEIAFRQMDGYSIELILFRRCLSEDQLGTIPVYVELLRTDR